jgi:hypothetical protein
LSALQCRCCHCLTRTARSSAGVSICTFVLVKQAKCVPGSVRVSQPATADRTLLLLLLLLRTRRARTATPARRNTLPGTQFTCFTSTKIHTLTPASLALWISLPQPPAADRTPASLNGSFEEPAATALQLAVEAGIRLTVFALRGLE